MTDRVDYAPTLMAELGVKDIGELRELVAFARKAEAVLGEIAHSPEWAAYDVRKMARGALAALSAEGQT